MRQFPKVRPGDPISAKDYNRRGDFLNQLGSTVSYGQEGTRNGAGLNITDRPNVPYIYAKLTGQSGAAYAWEEVVPATGGSWTVLTRGLTGTTSKNPAYERNGSTTVPINSVVKMERGFANTTSVDLEYIFDFSSAASSDLGCGVGPNYRGGVTIINCGALLTGNLYNGDIQDISNTGVLGSAGLTGVILVDFMRMGLTSGVAYAAVYSGIDCPSEGNRMMYMAIGGWVSSISSGTCTGTNTISIPYVSY